MKKIMLGLLSLATMLLFSINVYAVVIDPDWTVSDYDGNNGYEAFQVTGMYEFDDPAGSGNATIGTTNILSGSPYEATARAAFFVGNDTDDGEPSPSYNIGQAGDGLLNGDNKNWEVKGTVPQAYYQFDGYEFINEFQDVDGDGETDDPGWIHLGKQDGLNASFEVLPLNLWVDSRKWQPEQLPGQQKKSIPSSNPAVWVSTKKTSAGKGERDAAQVYTESDSIASWLCVRSHPFG